MPEASADSLRDRPLLVLMTSHWLSFLGMGLVGTALISWLFVLPLQVRGHVDNPYIGMVVFLVIPIVLVAGLGMVPVGDSRGGQPVAGAGDGPHRFTFRISASS